MAGPKTWIGRAGGVAQVTTYTVGGTLASGSTLTLTGNTRAVVYTCTGSDTTTTAAAALLAAVQTAATVYPEFNEVTWSVDAAVLTGTGPSDGTPFTITAAAGGSGTPTLTASTTATATGPNWWDNDDNWVEGAVPVDGDAVVIGDGPSILHGLDQSAVTLASLTITQGFPASNAIGLPVQNDAGYWEYRGTRLKIGVTAGTVDTRSSRIRLDLGGVASTFTVTDSGRAPAGQFAVDLLADESTTVVRVTRGQVGVCAGANETGEVATVRAAYRTRRDSDVSLELGEGLTLAALEQTGGDVVLRCAVTTLTREGGTLTRHGAGAVTTWNNDGGTANDYGTGTVTTLNQGGRWNRKGLAPLTVTTANLYPGGATNDPSGVVTWTNAPSYIKCGPPAAPGDTENQPPAVHHFNFGYGRKITIADV